MRKLLLSAALLTATVFNLNAQTSATFEDLTLPGSDTAYINYSSYGEDVGFTNGLAYFPCVYDTAWGYEFWAGGFAYSNKTDTATSGFTNQYSAKTGSGFAGSAQYAVAYGATNKIYLEPTAIGKSVIGFYLTNSTYAYNSMRDGDGFAKKFTGSDADWFRLDIFAYRSDTLGHDSVSVYLADFTHTDTTKNYILKDWVWVDLLKLGNADSLFLRLQSSDNGSFGMNTPAYYCIDNFTTNESGMRIDEKKYVADFKIYPNPASDYIMIQSGTETENKVLLSDLSGRIIGQYTLKPQSTLRIATEGFAPGTYLLQMDNGYNRAVSKFIKH